MTYIRIETKEEDRAIGKKNNQLVILYNNNIGRKIL